MQSVLFRAVVESAPSGILLVDGEDRVVLANPEAERVLGYATHEMEGLSIDALVPDTARELHASHRGAFRDAPAHRPMGAGRDLRARRKDGALLPVEVALKPVTVDGITYILVMLADISPRIDAAAAREHAESRMRDRQRLEAIGSFASGIGHEFNNLLGGIIGFVELVAPGLTDPQAQADLEQLRTGLQRGRNLVGHLMALARREPSPRVMVDLRGLLDEAGRLLRAALAPRVDVQVVYRPGDIRCEADSGAVLQVITQLASNAVRAMPHGGLLELSAAPLDVTRHDHPAGIRPGRYVVIVVRDNGSGMTAPVLSQAKAPFFTTQAPGDGSGLGLAIADRVMQDHDGALRIESTAGQGTTVSCYFRCGECSPLVERPATVTHEAPSVVRRRIFIVDDDQLLLRVGQRRLEAMGMEAVPFATADEALEALASGAQADAVVTDYSLPGLNGLQFAQQIREHFPTVPVIMMSGLAVLLSSEEASAAGVRHLLAKPVEMSDFESAITEALVGS